MLLDLDYYQKEECRAFMEIARQRGSEVRRKYRLSRADPIFEHCFLKHFEAQKIIEISHVICFIELR